MSGEARETSWKGARIVVMGLARSGVAACLFLKRRGALVTGADVRTADQLGSSVAELSRAEIPLSLGAYPNLSDLDALVLSPGVDPAQEVIEEARAKGVLILPELELGARAFKGRLICITGTKGKSTTTMSLHAMLREGGMDARAVGNIGAPITAHVEDSDERSIFVTEASSFQLETTRDFRPDCAIFLNLFPDHLDRHPTFASYAAAKARIFANQTPQDTAIVNAEDQGVVDLAARTPAQVIPFRPKTAPSGATLGPVAYFEGHDAVFRKAGPTPLFGGADVQIPGSAVRANLLAAATAAHDLGVPTTSIRQAVRSFRGVPHTFEKLGEINGVAYFNDSKATTPESVLVALESFDRPVIAILGGRLKAGSFRSLRDAVASHVRSIYAIGESRGLVRAALQDVRPVHESDTLEEAVLLAYREAKPGDAVLLSPGCASFDMFRDYAERGDVFKRAFQSLPLQGAA
ncbi:MAG: UDP-N-acetylmuramoyl-L-alanine--D-glutamate ligase [Vicinamibacteria bacterium]|nr:UDP-N-acetylmuramoyl-L-alanine--D-glutamate ligase [Vicinamibacteria bacterium]